MAKEVKKEKKEKKEKKRSETDGVHKSSSSKKDKSEKKKDKHAKKALVAEKDANDGGEVKPVAETVVEDVKPGKNVVAAAAEDASDEEMAEVNGNGKGAVVVKEGRPVGALVPFANPLADEKVGKKVLKGVKKGMSHTLISLYNHWILSERLQCLVFTRQPFYQRIR